MINILHIASFTGNIGDNINHIGFRPWLEKLIGLEVLWTSLEIRKFYWNQTNWDQSFVDYANSFDLIVIGGGNYFELWVDKSPTGTSIEIEPFLFEKIKTPVFFNALGVDAGQGASSACISKFQHFLNVAKENDKSIFSVRNDGAQKTLKNVIGKEYFKLFELLPDHGFFISDEIDWKKRKVKKYICFNLACDMPDLRFIGDDKSFDNFINELSTAVEQLSKKLEDFKFIFVPHMYSDLKIISRVIENCSDTLRRTKISVHSLVWEMMLP